MYKLGEWQNVLGIAFADCFKPIIIIITKYLIVYYEKLTGIDKPKHLGYHKIYWIM